MLLGIVYGVLLLKNGSSFESFVSYVYSKLLSLNGYNEVVVSKNVKIKDSDDVVNEFDVFYEFSHLNLTCKVAIECKDWNYPVSVNEVRDFCRKIESIEFCQIIGVMVAKKGYQSSAISFAKARGIKLLTVDDLPKVPEIVAGMISNAFLPESNAVGDPFWTLMRVQNGHLTGEYISIHKQFDDDRPTIPLLFSKVLAQNLLDMQMEKDDWCVRGISQYQLEVLLNMHKLGNIQFALFPAVWNDSTLHCVIAEAHIVKELYLRK